MSGLKPTARTFVSSLLLCVLALMSVTSSVCPVCDRMEQPSTRHASLHNADQDGTSDCDRDACSCCGLQFVAAWLQPTPALSKFAATPELFLVRVPTAPALRLYRPPRN